MDELDGFELISFILILRILHDTNGRGAMLRCILDIRLCQNAWATNASLVL